MGKNTFGNDAVRFSRNFGEGLVARMTNDPERAKAAFTAARQEQEKIVAAEPDYGPSLCVLGLIDAGLGRKEEALRAGRRAVELLPVAKDASNGAHMIEYLAMIAAWVGEKDLACQQLATAIRPPNTLSYGQLKLLPGWDPLRGDPRFERMVASLAPAGTAARPARHDEIFHAFSRNLSPDFSAVQGCHESASRRGPASAAPPLKPNPAAHSYYEITIHIFLSPVFKCSRFSSRCWPFLSLPRRRTNDAKSDEWTWQNPLPQGNDLRDVCFVDANIGTAVGYYGTIVRTTDGGNSWTIQQSGTSLDLWGVSFSDASNGTAVGAGGMILRTTDGGEHWNIQASGTVEELRDVSFADANNGTAVGFGGLILHTTDGGSTWVPQASGTLDTLFGVSLIDANTGTAVGGTLGSK